MAKSIREYRISEKTAEALQSSLTVPIDKAMMLDFEDELALVESIRGSKPEYPASFQDALAPRGSVSLARGAQTLPYAIAEGLAEMDLAYAV